MPDQEGKPTPEETAQAYRDFQTEAQLEGMLAEVERLTGGKEILGPDGQQIKDPEEKKKAMQQMLDQERQSKIRQLMDRMQALSYYDEKKKQPKPMFAACMEMLREAHCLIMLAMTEMSVLEGVDDELIGFTNEVWQHAVRSDTEDDLSSLEQRLGVVMTTISNLVWEQKRLIARRRPAADQLMKLHPENKQVIDTTCLMDLGMPKCDMPMGMTHLLFQEGFDRLDEAVSAALGRLDKAGYECIFLAAAAKGDGCIPAKWWLGACDQEKTLVGVLDPVLKKRPTAQILIVESLDLLLGDEKRAEGSPKDLQQALLRIARWCLKNRVLGLVFSEGTAESRKYMGRSITLRKGGANVGSGNVSDGGGSGLDEPVSDRSGQTLERSGEDQGESGGEGSEATG